MDVAVEAHWLADSGMQGDAGRSGAQKSINLDSPLAHGLTQLTLVGKSARSRLKWRPTQAQFRSVAGGPTICNNNPTKQDIIS